MSDRGDRAVAAQSRVAAIQRDLADLSQRLAPLSDPATAADNATIHASVTAFVEILRAACMHLSAAVEHEKSAMVRESAALAYLSTANGGSDLTRIANLHTAEMHRTAAIRDRSTAAVHQRRGCYRDIVHAIEPVPPLDGVDIIMELCQVSTASDETRPHRGVLPPERNVFVDPHDVLQRAAALGTIHYLSPEQVGGYSVDARSAVYSLGCIFYRVLTGTTPFSDDDPATVGWSHVQQRPIPPSGRNPEIPSSLDVIALRALTKSPNHRYQSPHQMHAALREARNHVIDALTS